MRLKNDITADQVKENTEDEKRNQSEQVGIWAMKEWIVRSLPLVNSMAYRSERSHQFFCRDHDSRNCAARNVSGREQDTRTLVAFGSQFDVRQILVTKFDSQIAIDQTTGSSHR